MGRKIVPLSHKEVVGREQGAKRRKPAALLACQAFRRAFARHHKGVAALHETAYFEGKVRRCPE
jgi:hypothetical protein